MGRVSCVGYKILLVRSLNTLYRKYIDDICLIVLQLLLYYLLHAKFI